MTRAIALAAGALLFVLTATANSGGYRFGASDQAFYGPAIMAARDATLFPRDHVVLDAQRQYWIGDEVLAWASRLAGGDWPAYFLIVYLIALVALFTAAVGFARALGASWWTVAAFTALLTLRHRIAKTGANTLEGYMHPRILAFALGVAACAAIARRRWAWAAVAIVIAGVIHTTTALWFAVVGVTAFAVAQGFGRAFVAAFVGGAAVTLWAVLAGPLTQTMARMDAAWLAVLAEKDYLFPTAWPLYAWLLNSSYFVLMLVLYRRRLIRGVTAPGEGALVAGLVGIVSVFLVSLPLSAAKVALAVQLQVNRVFWILDFVVAFYLAWWIVTDLVPQAAVRARAVVVGVLLALAIGRGFYVNRIEAGRSLFEVRLPATPWNDMLAWLETQPSTWHVLADPAHAWKHGVSVRIGARRDVLLESGKDSALAMYDRQVAMRVAERSLALANFGEMTAGDVRRLAQRYELDVFVDASTRTFDLPELYRNSQFVAYALR